jgi:hypothetical protein
MQLSKPQIIAIAACHKCAARPKQPCIFTRQEDPRGLRAAAMQSHLDRIQRARNFIKNALDPATLKL